MTKPRLLLLLLTIVCCLTGWSVNGAVTLTQSGNACTIRNDFVSVYISKDGEITSLLKCTVDKRYRCQGLLQLHGWRQQPELQHQWVLCKTKHR